MSLKPAPSPTSIDLTSSTGAATDIAPLGQSAAENLQFADWEKAAATEEFKSLIKLKIKFIAPAIVFYMVYYFALLVLVGYRRDLMETQVLGVNLAYLFALSQFVMVWVMAALYVRVAGRFDKMADAIVNRLKSQKK